jgi:hypothetical protein
VHGLQRSRCLNMLRRILNELVLEEINEDCYKVDQEFWPQITAMLAPQMGGSPDSRGTPPGPPQAPRSRLPQKLFGIFGGYAVALFQSRVKSSGSRWAGSEAMGAPRKHALVMERRGRLASAPVRYRAAGRTAGSLSGRPAVEYRSFTVAAQRLIV